MKKFTEQLKEQEFINKYQDFLEFCCERLELEDLPEIELIDDKQLAIENKSFGGYHPGTQEIKINIAERHIADVFRTLAHELTHYKQHLDNRLDENSGETGSDIENEANAMAGIIMREYARETQGNIFEENSDIENSEESILMESQFTGRLGNSRYTRQLDALGNELERQYSIGGAAAVKNHLNRIDKQKYSRHLHALHLFNMGKEGKGIHPIAKIIRKHL